MPFSDMNSFIPEEDMPAFEKFISNNNLRPKSSPAHRVPAPTVPPPPPHGPTGKKAGQGTSDVDRVLQDLDKDTEDLITTNF